MDNIILKILQGCQKKLKMAMILSLVQDMLMVEGLKILVHIEKC